MPVSDTPPQLRLAFYGDDFTGSTDTLATLSDAGLRAMLFLRVPAAEQLQIAGPLDALGIAGAARSMAPEAMREELEPVGRFFASLRVPILQYKTCSTFDSAPHVGSIGVAIDVLRRVAPNPLVAIVGGQPNLGRYCVFANLFAAVSSGGSVVRIDRHPTMRVHPVTPMQEADLRVHLAAQGLARVVSIDATTYELAAADQEAGLERVMADSPDAVLFDVGRQPHLAAIGRLVCRHAQKAPLLLVGPSGATQALLEYWREDGASMHLNSVPGWAKRISPATGPVFALAGSLSPTTARQLDSASAYVRSPLDAQRVIAHDSAYIDAWIDHAATQLRAGKNVLAHTSRGDADGGPPRAAHELAAQCGVLLARLMQQVPVRRVGIAGGDTSSYAVKALDIWALSHVGSLAPGVALCRAHSYAPHLEGVEFMLKGGQMGPDDLFDRLLAGN
jgi:3-oxoisoapionate kinase